MKINRKSLKDYWKISLDEYNSGGWGGAFGGFKVNSSTIKRFTRKKTNPDGTVATNPDGTTQMFFDAEACFDEIAIMYLNAVVASYEVLRDGVYKWMDEDDRENLRKAVYAAVEFGVANKQLWENVNGSSISMPNFNVDVAQTSWLLTSDMFGMKAQNYLTNANLDEYDSYLIGMGYNESVVKDGAGNFRVIGKADLSAMPELK